MFTSHTPRAGKSAETSHRSSFTRAGAALGVISLTAGFVLLAAPANAATAGTSYAEGQFLSGTIAGLDLDDIAALAAAEARNNGNQDKQTSKDPLDAEVIRTVDVQSPEGVQLNLGDFLDAGAVNQYAEADRNGTSLAASGAVGDDGAIGVGSVGNGPAGDLDVDLNALLGSRFSSVLSDLTLSLDAVSAQASANLASASGDYTIAGATLNFTSPAIGDLGGKVGNALAGVDQQLVAIGGDDGALGNAVDGILDPVLGVVGSSANVTVNVDADLQGAVQSLLTGTYGNGAVHFNLQTGEVTVDLETLLGGELNDLPANTEILTDGVVNQILRGITDTVSSLSDQIVGKVTEALHGAQVSVNADLNLLTGQGAAQNQVCHDIQVPIIGDILGGLGGLLGGATQGIIGYTTQSVCEIVDSALPDLSSTVSVDIQATVDQLLNGVAAKADASISLLNGTADAPISVDALIGSLGTGLNNSLFGSDSVVSDLVDGLNAGLVNPAVTGLLGDNGVDAALTDVLSVKVNNQEVSNGLFTETAVRVAVLRDAGAGGLATVNVAAATVGPNVTTVVDPGCTTDCGPGNPGDPGDPGNPGNPGNPGTGTTGNFHTAAGNLAYTGMGITTLIAVILALLAAGAYLAREGYRRRHSAAVIAD